MKSIPLVGWAMIFVTIFGVFAPYASFRGDANIAYRDDCDPISKPSRPACDEPNYQQPRLEDMIGQMLIVGFNGTKPSQSFPKTVAQQLKDGQIGGVMFMNGNIRSRRQVKRLASFFAQSSPGLPVLISVDQEGGSVQRLSRRKGFSRFASAKIMASRKTPEEAQEIYRKMGQELRDVGFNLNFGPVVDLDLERRNPVIGGKRRSYSADAKTVTQYARAFVRAHREAGVLTALKHFPGHGSSRTDSHKQLVDVSESWQEIELAPYKDLTKDGLVDMVMVGHLYHPDFSGPEKQPATLAGNAIEDALRKQIGFRGVAITDDMEMGAIIRHHSFDDSLVKAVKAGNDILLISNRRWQDSSMPLQAIRAIKRAVVDGRISRERIRESYDRIVALKRSLGTMPIASNALDSGGSVAGTR